MPAICRIPRPRPQTLMMPAMSAAAAFFPLAVQIHAKQGDTAVRSHLANASNCWLGITLPACLGFAMISAPRRQCRSRRRLPRACGTDHAGDRRRVVFQVLTQQYLHASFLLSGRNSLLSDQHRLDHRGQRDPVLCPGRPLRHHRRPHGRGWAPTSPDLSARSCSARFAFPLPLPLGRLALTMIADWPMALIVGALDRSLHMADLAACIVLVSAGFVVYAALCWLFDISRIRGPPKAGLCSVPNQISKHQYRVR